MPQNSNLSITRKLLLLRIKGTFCIYTMFHNDLAGLAVYIAVHPYFEECKTSIYAAHPRQSL